LTEEHWVVIDIIRDYYEEYGYPPQMKIIVKEMKKLLGIEKGTQRYFYKLFPAGPYKHAYKIAGIQVSYSTCGCEAPLIRRYLWSKTYGIDGEIVTELASK
jgi:TusE/DsrC/DsvC family sulfur relay protein